MLVIEDVGEIIRISIAIGQLSRVGETDADIAKMSCSQCRIRERECGEGRERGILALYVDR